MPKLPGYPVLPERAIAHGATTPNPGRTNALAWSTVENDVVAWSSTSGSWRVPGKAVSISKLLAVSGFTGVNRYATQTSGGEAGIATGFGNFTFFRLRAPVTGTSVLRRRIYGSNGWQHVASSSGLNCNYFLTNTSAVAGTTVPLSNADVGRVHAYLTRITATPGNIETFYDTLQYANVALASYAPATLAAQTLGCDDGGAYPASVFDIIGELDFRGVPTVAQILAFLLAVRTSGDVPTTFAGATVTHRWSVRDAMYGQSYVDGQVGPGSMADTITGASIDLKSRAGSPTLREIDLTADGRKSSGVTAFSNTANLEAAVGIRGVTSGFVVSMIVQDNANDGGIYTLASTFGANVGWIIQKNAQVWAASAGNGSTYYSTPTLPANAAQLGKPRHFVMRYDGTRLELQIDGVLSGKTASSFTFSPGSLPMKVGNHTDGTQPCTALTVYEIAGADGVPSDAQMLANYQEFVTTGKLSQVQGTTSFKRWPISDALIAAGQEVPATIAEQASSNPLVRSGGLQVGAGNGITGFTKDARPYPDTFAGAAAGFVVEVLFVAGANSPGEALFSTRFGNTGFEIIGFNNYYTWAISNGSAGTSFAGYTCTPGTLYHFAYRYDGTTAYGYVNGNLVQSVAYAFSPSTSGFRIGHYDSVGSYPCTLNNLRGVTASLVVPTLAQIQASATAALSAGKLVGATGVQKRWSMVDDVIDAGGRVPVMFKERVSGATSLVGALPITNGKLEVAARVERPVAYDAAPLLQGARPTAAAQHYIGATALADMFGPIWWTLVFTVIDQTSTGNVHILAGNNYGSNGFTVYSTANNSNVYVGVATSSGFYQTQGGAIAAADVGKVQVISGVYGGGGLASTLQSYMKRQLDNTQSTAGTFAASTDKLVLLSESNPSARPGYGVVVHGFACGQGMLTLGEYQAHYDAIIAADGDVQAIPNKTAHLYSFLRDSAGGALPATLLDRAGSYNLALTGAPTMQASYARAFAA